MLYKVSCLIVLNYCLYVIYVVMLNYVQLWLQTRIPARTWDHNPCEKLHCKYVALLVFLPCSFSYCKLSSCDQLPDGRVIKVGTERFQAPEALFTPVRLFHFCSCIVLLLIAICNCVGKVSNKVVFMKYLLTGTDRCWRWWDGRYGISLHSGNGYRQPDDGIHILPVPYISGSTFQLFKWNIWVRTLVDSNFVGLFLPDHGCI